MATWRPRSSATAGATPLLVSTGALGRGLAALRIFVGIICLANGFAKLTGERNVTLGWYHGFLVVRGIALNTGRRVGRGDAMIRSWVVQYEEGA